MYTPELADHLANPRNVGELENPTGTGDVVNEVCLDRIRLTVRVDQGILTEAKVKASGCPPTLAAASALTELIVGVRVEALRSLSADAVEAKLGRLPIAKQHCAQLAIEALREALEGRRDSGS
jgi:NifU-like protein involved in Fe-S cluster formation